MDCKTIVFTYHAGYNFYFAFKKHKKILHVINLCCILQKRRPHKISTLNNFLRQSIFDCSQTPLSVRTEC